MNAKDSKPRKVSITISHTALDKRRRKESLETLIDQALEIILPDGLNTPGRRERDRAWLMRRAIEAVSKTIIREQCMPAPLEVHFSRPFRHLRN
jgi:hypothetical protein